MKKYAIGADIGGTHITTAVVDLDKIEIIPSSIVTLEVDTDGPSDGILGVWTASIKASLKQAMSHDKKVTPESVAGIGLAMPGPFDYEDGIALITQQTKLRSLYKKSVRYELGERLGLLSDDPGLTCMDISPKNILFKNDAECFLLGEVMNRKDKKIKRAIGITLGTGFGSSFYLDGKLEDGNLWCAPYKDKMVEDYISTRWFVNNYKELAKKDISGVKELVLSYDSDSVSRNLFKEFGNNLAEFLSILAVEKRADTIIIGGKIALSMHLFIEPLQKKLKELSPQTQILGSLLGEEAALFGSASLVLNK